VPIRFLSALFLLSCFGCSHSALISRAPAVALFPQTSDTSKAPYQVSLKNETHSVRIINDGMADLFERLEMIKHAQREIVYESYLFKNDTVGKLILQAMAQRKTEVPAIQIYMLIDFYNDLKGPTFTKNEIAAIEEAGINFRFYNRGRRLRVALIPATKNLPLGFKKMNHRDHRKLFVVDGDQQENLIKDGAYGQMIVGGRNTADEYFGLSETYNYMDRDIWVKGPITFYARNSFQEYWTNKDWVHTAELGTDKKKIAEARALIFDSNNTKLNNTLNLMYGNHLAENSFNTEKLFEVKNVAIYTDKPFHILKDRDGAQEYEPTEDRVITPFMHESLKFQKGRITVENYNLAMSESKERIFFGDMDQQAHIRMLTNGFLTTDNPYSTVLSHLVETDLVRTAAQKKLASFECFDVSGRAPEGITFFGDQFKQAKWADHSKTTVARGVYEGAVEPGKPLPENDEYARVNYTMIGSYNFDMRSELINNEFLFVVDDRDVAKEVEKSIEGRIKNAFDLEENGEYNQNHDPKPPKSIYSALSPRDRKRALGFTKKYLVKGADEIINKADNYESVITRGKGLRRQIFSLY
jgi:putative cardiolipin synthase